MLMDFFYLAGSCSRLLIWDSYHPDEFAAVTSHQKHIFSTIHKVLGSTQGGGETGHLPPGWQEKIQSVSLVLLSALGRERRGAESCLTLLIDSCFYLRACLKPPSSPPSLPFSSFSPSALSPFSLLSSFLSFPFCFFPSTHLLSIY